MVIEMTSEPVPLALDNDGVIQVAGTRVTLDTVIATFNEGAAAEEIVANNPLTRSCRRACCHQLLSV